MGRCCLKGFYFILEGVSRGDDRGKFRGKGIGAFDGASMFGCLFVENGFLSELEKKSQFSLMSSDLAKGRRLVRTFSLSSWLISSSKFVNLSTSPSAACNLLS